MAGFWLIPEYGTDVLLTSMAIILLVLPFLFVPALRTPVARVSIASFALLALLGSWLLPHLSYKDLISSVQYDDEAFAGKKPDYLFLKEGKAGVISMVTYDGRQVKLQNNGLNESFIDLEDENNVLLVESLLGLVPYMVHENPKSAFVVGFGGGITTKALTLTQLESIRVVELEPAVVEAGRAIVGGEIPALQDSRVTLTLNDARNTLLTESTKYDIIAAQPSHPWLARASNVFTKDFFELISSRLNEGGIYGQWVNLFHMDATTLKSLLRAFYEVFPHGMTFANLDTGDFIMYGSGSPMIFNFEQMNERLNRQKFTAALNYHDIYHARDLMWYFSLSREEALAASMDVPANTDTNILSEVRLSAMDDDAPPEEDPYDFLRSEYRFNVRPHFGADAVERIYKLGTYYLSEWDAPMMAQYAADQLRDLDPVKGRGIEYEKLWHRFEFDEADALFGKYEKWPDRTYLQQALLLADRGRYDEAAGVVQQVKKENLRRTLSARLLYEQGRYDELVALNAKYDAEKMWRLSALAKRDLAAAGAGLHVLVQRVSPRLPQMRVLAGYYGSINDAPQLDRMARLIINQQDKEIERIQILLSEAVEAGQVARSKDLLKRIDALNPEANSELNVLRDKVGRLGASL
jgi:spermidine synthase